MSSHAPLPRRSRRTSRPARGPATIFSQTGSNGLVASRDRAPRPLLIHRPTDRGDAFSRRSSGEEAIWCPNERKAERHHTVLQRGGNAWCAALVNRGTGERRPLGRPARRKRFLGRPPPVSRQLAPE